MRKKLVLSCVLFVACIFFSDISYAQEKQKEAYDLAVKAYRHYHEVGAKKAFADFSDKDGEFVKDELYVFAFNYDGVCLAHGGNNNLIGMNMMNMRDVARKAYVEEFTKTAKEDGKGWVNYKWLNPITKTISNKKSYIIRIDNNKYVGVGYYLD